MTSLSNYEWRLAEARRSRRLGESAALVREYGASAERDLRLAAWRAARERAEARSARAGAAAREQAERALRAWRAWRKGRQFAAEDA